MNCDGENSYHKGHEGHKEKTDQPFVSFVPFVVEEDSHGPEDNNKDYTRNDKQFPRLRLCPVLFS
jgi:hypothetical protein